MDYSEFFISTKKKPDRPCPYSGRTRGQTTAPTVCCWDSVHALARCVLYDDCCVNFGSQTICTTPSARCYDKDFLSNTHIGQPTAQNTAYIPGTGLFEVGLQAVLCRHSLYTLCKACTFFLIVTGNGTCADWLTHSFLCQYL